MIPVDAGELGGAWRFEPRGAPGGGRVVAGPSLEFAPGAAAERARWTAPPEVLFERSRIACRPEKRPDVSTRELEWRRNVLDLEPSSLPLRAPITLTIPRAMAADTSRLGLFRYGSDGWEWVAMKRAPSGDFAAETRRLGAFALFADTLAPRVTPLAAPGRPAKGPYNRWALEARLEEGGSGVDARASYVMIDGVRRPAEWDSEEGVLRWRPRRAPSRGDHRFEFVAADRAGNVARRSGRFVLD